MVHLGPGRQGCLRRVGGWRLPSRPQCTGGRPWSAGSLVPPLITPRQCAAGRWNTLQRSAV
eukprot:2980894-Pyramimonas_sp.AAC.1